MVISIEAYELFECIAQRCAMAAGGIRSLKLYVFDIFFYQALTSVRRVTTNIQCLSIWTPPHLGSELKAVTAVDEDDPQSR